MNKKTSFTDKTNPVIPERSNRGSSERSVRHSSQRKLL